MVMYVCIKLYIMNIVFTELAIVHNKLKYLDKCADMMDDTCDVTLLHSKRPKLHRVLAVLRAIESKALAMVFQSNGVKGRQIRKGCVQQGSNKAAKAE